MLQVRLCLVAVVTCPDNGWRSTQKLNHYNGILDALPVGVFRLPSLDSSTRLKAFQRAYENEGVELTTQALELLQSFARSQLWARGRFFSLVACMTKQLMLKNGRSAAGKLELEEAFANFAFNSPGSTADLFRKMDDFKNRQVAFLRKEKAFDSVGGTEKAKMALQDALLLDSTQRSLLHFWGVDSPVGVLVS